MGIVVVVDVIVVGPSNYHLTSPKLAHPSFIETMLELFALINAKCIIVMIYIYYQVTATFATKILCNSLRRKLVGILRFMNII